MSLFNETFEYLTHNLPCPSNAEFEAHDYDSSEYKTLEWARQYWDAMLNELGALGWELISITDNPASKSKSTKRLVFKRSSRSKYYGTGFGVNMTRISDLAKQAAEDGHLN